MLVLGVRSDQIRSVAQSCLTLCNPMNHSTPGLPVPHQLPEFTQTHVHRVSDAIQPSHPLSSPSPPAPNPSQHQSLGLFKYLRTICSCIKHPLSFELSLVTRCKYISSLNPQFPLSRLESVIPFYREGN